MFSTLFKLHKNFLHNSFHRGLAEKAEPELASRIRMDTERSFNTMRDTSLQTLTLAQSLEDHNIRMRQPKPHGATLSLPSSVLAFIPCRYYWRKDIHEWTINFPYVVDQVEHKMEGGRYVRYIPTKRGYQALVTKLCIKGTYLEILEIV